MKDPRLAEIEFLAALDRNMGNKRFHVQTAGADAHFGEKYFGLNAWAFKTMVFELAREGAIGGPAEILLDRGGTGSLRKGMATVHGYADLNTQVLLEKIWNEEEFIALITHTGRLRLWRTRDELLRDRIRDGLQVLWDQRHWKPDLNLRTLMRDKDAPFSVLRFDMDHFKPVNDTLGHQAGDDVLARAMRIVLDGTQGAGEAYRVGGDEFGVILPGTDHDTARRWRKLFAPQ